MLIEGDLATFKIGHSIFDEHRHFYLFVNQQSWTPLIVA